MLCIKWEDYNKYIAGWGIPSIAASSCACSSILHTYQYILSVSYYPFISIIDLVSFLFILALIYTLLYSFNKNKIIALLKIAIAFIWIAAVIATASFRTIAMCAYKIAPHKGIFHGKVLHTQHKRYNTIATIWCTGINGQYKAYCHFDHVHTIHNNDVIVFNATAYPTRNDNNSKQYLAQRGISAVFYLSNNSIVMHTVAAKNYRTKVQELLQHSLYRTMTHDAASLLAALYLGNKEIIHPHVQMAFKEAGVLHVLAASGLHVGIIMATILALCRLCKAPKKIAVMIASSGVLIYLYISYQPVSLLRASIMCAVAATAVLLNMQKHSINLLCCAACIILCIYPYEIFSAGFQLSFMATAGILLVYKQYHNGLKHCGRITSALAITFAAQLFTMPVSVYHFHELSVTAFLANLVIIPMVSIFMIAGSCIPLFCHAGLTNVASFIMHHIYTIIVKLTQFFASFHGSIYIDSLLLAGIYLIILIIPLVYKKKANIVILCGIIALLLYHNQPQNKVIHYNGGDSSWYTVLLDKGSACCIIDLKSFNDYDNLTSQLKKHSVTKVHIMLPNASNKNCTYAAMLAKQFALQDIAVGDYALYAIKKITTIASVDAIPIYFTIPHNKTMMDRDELIRLYYTTKNHTMKGQK